MAAPLSWLAFFPKYAVCSLPQLCVLCCSHNGQSRMDAIEQLMRRGAAGAPRNMRALQLFTDIVAVIPGFRWFYLWCRGHDVQVCDATREWGGGEWIWQAGIGGPEDIFALPKEERRLILYFHGGAFVLCNSATHRALTYSIAHVTGMPVLSAQYRRAPQHRFPAALDDALEIYCKVINSFDPSHAISLCSRLLLYCC